MACAQGVVKSYDNILLECNGGHTCTCILLTRNWPKYLMECMRLVKRRGSTKAKVYVSDFDQLKSQVVFDVKAMLEMEEYPCELVINWDQTGIHYVSVSS